MAKQRKIIVRGKQRVNIDPLVFLQLLLAISDEWDSGRDGDTQAASPDAFDAAIEDRASDRLRRYPTGGGTTE